jgi:Fibronectin type III domain
MSGRGRHRASRSRRGLGLRILLFVAGFVLAGSTAAMAFFVINVVDGNSPATSQAAALAAPTAPTASADDTSGTITIGWTAASQPPGAPVQYQVVRSSGPGSPDTVCTVQSGPSTCQDTGLTAGTVYDYSITAVLDNWQSPTVTASATTATPSLAITLSTSSPVAGDPVTVQSIAALVNGSVDPTYAGSKTITWSGLGNGPRGQVPSYPTGSITFVNGVATPTGPGSTFAEFEAGPEALHASDAGAATVEGQAAVAVTSAPASAFALSTPSTQNAGTPFDETITALDAYGNTATGLEGTQAVVFGGLSDSPDGSAPAYPSSVTFTDGVGSAAVTDSDAESTALTATQGVLTGTTGTFTVRAAGAYSFVLPTPSTQRAGAPFNETVAALDAYGNTANGFVGPEALVFGGPSNSPNGNSPSYPASVLFADGMGTASLTLPDEESTALTATEGAITGRSGTFTVAATAATSFLVSTPSTQSAGTAFDETIAAVDAEGNVANGWSDVTECVTMSGPSSSPDATAPAYPAPGACPTGESSLAFDGSGRATASVTLFDAGTTALTATDDAITGTSGTFTVRPLAASSFLLTTPSTPTAGTAFDEPITATDLYANTATGYAGPEALTFSGPSDGPDDTAPLYPASVSFTAGVGTASITLSAAESTTLTAAQGTVTGTSSTFTVGAAGAGATGAETSVVLRATPAHDRVGHRTVARLWQVLAETLS